MESIHSVDTSNKSDTLGLLEKLGKKIFFMPLIIFALLLIGLRCSISSLFTLNAAHIFLIVISFFVAIVSSNPFVLPQIFKGDNDKQFRHALFIFATIYIVISALLVVGIPSDSLRVDVGYLVLFMISFLYALNLYLTLLWLHRLPSAKKKAQNTIDLKNEIVRLIDALAARADSLGDNYSKERERVLLLPEKAREIKDAQAIEAAVMEQNIMSHISAFTAVYENALSGATPDLKKFNQALDSLESIIQMRTKLNNQK